MTISVIIPAYNAANFITRAIQSVQEQTFAPLEILVIDDGSTDATAEVVARYITNNAPLPLPVILLRQENGGPAAARNYGAREAKGQWLAFLDADDTFLPHKLEKQIALTNDPRVGVVHGREKPTNEPITFETLWRKNQITNSTTLVRKSAFEQAGGFDEDRAVIGVEDYNLWLRLAYQKWEFAVCAENLICYTPAPNSLSNQVEQFVRAELANAEKMAQTLSLSPQSLSQKRGAIYEEYGILMISTRSLTAARHYLASALRAKPSLRRLFWFAAACVPSTFLNTLQRYKKMATHTI